MRRISSRWLMAAGLFAAMGGCRHLESPGSGEPAALAPVAPKAGLQPMPSIPMESATSVWAPKQVAPNQEAVHQVEYRAVPKKLARRPAPKQEPVQQVEYRAVVSSLGHAPDHGWLVGRLERDEAKDRWFVRYADPGEQETFGGRLELLRTGTMAGFRVGQLVRAEGTLVDPAPYETRPAYRILSLQAIRE